MRQFADEIVLGTVLVLLLIVAGGALFWRAEEQDRRRECEADLLRWAQDKSADIARWRKERLADARVIGANRVLAAALSDFLRTRREADRQLLLEIFAPFKAYGYADVIVTDSAGRNIWNLAKTHDHIHEPSLAECEAALRSGRPQTALVDWHLDHENRIHPHLAAMATVVDPENHAIVGFVFLVMEIERLQEIIASHKAGRKTMDIQVVRRDGDHALLISGFWQKGSQALRLRTPLSKKESTAVMAVEDRHGVMRGVDDRGMAVLSAILPVPDSPWFLICQQDESEVLALHRSQPVLILIAVAALLAAAVMGGGLLLQRRQKRLALAQAAAAQAAQQEQAVRLHLAEQARAILMSIGDAVIVADACGHVEMMNSVAEALTGWPLAEAAGRPLAEIFRIINEETRQAVESPVARVLREGVVVGLANHTILLTHDGAERPIADSGAPIRGSDGNIRGVVLVFRDQSQERAAEQRLRASEERLRLLIERMSSGVAIYKAVDEGQDFCFVDINPAVERIEKVKREEVIGRRVTAVFPGVRDFGILDVFRRVWQSGEPEHFPVAFYRDERISGWRENFIYRLPSGEVVAVYDDRTAEKQAEEAVQNARALLENITETVPVAITVVNADGRIAFANRRAEEILGLKREQLLRMAYNAPDFRIEAIAGGPFPENELPFARVMASGQAVADIKHAIVTPDGKRRELAINAAPMRDASGRLTGMVAAFTDITEQRKFEQRLLHAEKMDAIGQLASGVAHDFNNQLAGILGYAEILLDRLQDAKLRQYAESICAAAQCAADVARQLLVFSRKDRQIIVPVDLHQVIAEVVKLLEHTVDKRITIRQNLHASPHHVSGDPSQLQTAILNLALNSRDAMPQGGMLTISTAVVELPADEGAHMPAGRYLRLSVADTGVGMDAETRRHLFEPFFTTKMPGKGTGLGLAAVYGAVRSHNGRIEVASEPGKGSEFSIFLPLLETAAYKEEVINAGGVSAQKPARILVVDDEELLRNLAAEVLQELGYRVTTCKDGDEAIGYYLQSWEHVDLVILDMIMPKRSGHETFVALRKINPRVRVLIASGYSLTEDVRQVFDEGALGFLQKPFRRDELARKVAEALAQDT